MEVEMEVEIEDDNGSGNTAVEFTFTAVEIDLDYEFEAARFFDFTREESIDEAREAEMWFDSVQSYPPSPFAVRLIAREQSENAKPSTSSNQLENDSDVIRAPGDSNMDLSNTAVISHTDEMENGRIHLDFKNSCLQALHKQQTTNTIPKDNTKNANYKSKTKSRTSTLMKPTASQLAKQNQDRLVDNFRFQKLGNSSSGVESQATKRQKLEGGHLFKVMSTNQETNFVHKAPKKEGIVDGNVGHTRLRITVPRPPDLATAQRAQRIRQKGDTGNEYVASRATGFRALPLNKKIFEAPSLLHQKRSTSQLPQFQEFYLKTTERAAQNTAAVPSTSKAQQKPGFAFASGSSNRESKGPQDCETIHRYKALPLNQKAFSFQTEKRGQHAPPVDLFNKLSLAPESSSQLNRPRTRATSVFTKGLKENRVCSFQQQSQVKVKLPKSGSKQVQFHIDKSIPEGTPFARTNRNLGIH